MIRKFIEQDMNAVTEILCATKVFREEEIAVAVELMETSVQQPEQHDYLLYTDVDDTQVVRGYYCVGPTPMTQSTFDLYWIAVDPGSQQHGIGGGLLSHCESLVQSMGGSLMIVETSSTPKYRPTRNFYLKHHYTEAARIAHYYAPGDDLVMYSKNL
jgi:ribosomal protein S18 acetylase RimI-like enzyme